MRRHQVLRREQVATDAELTRMSWELQDGRIPVVDAYTYLGLNIDRDVTLEGVVHHNAAKGARALGALRPFLANRTIPPRLKVTALKALLAPVLLYGADMSSTRPSGWRWWEGMPCQLL